ncbi:hypothetical protein [Helicobacter felistomachi]|uniref:hypothetical protein n=1 Tax=Helicobacter felistomachi TaxID=3040201 RepID=UPI00257333A6|nr:hypothetical protein [Helicobacter sp. NHP21005]
MKLFEKYAQVFGATDICVKDLDLSGLQIGYSKEGKEKIFNLAFPNPLENFEGIRDALIALLGEEAAAQEQPNPQQNQQQGFGPQAQGFNPHNPQGFSQQSGFNPQAQHPFSAHAPFGAQSPRGANPQQGFNPQTQGFQGLGPQAMPFGPMGFHAHNPQWGFNPQGFNPQAQHPQPGFDPQHPQGGFGPQSDLAPQAQGFDPQNQNHLTESAQPPHPQPTQSKD